MANKTEPKIIFFDIEILADMKQAERKWFQLSQWPGLTLKADINSIICFGYKVFGAESVKCLNAWDYIAWNKNVNDDYELVKEIAEVLNSADCIVTHNGKRFDLKFINTRLLIHGLNPIPPILHVDTCSLLKSNLYLFNNKLETAARALTDDSKMDNGGIELWCNVRQRQKSAMKKMTDYCKQDVLVTEKVFKKLRPFIKNIPNYNIYRTREEAVCPNCGSTRLEGHGLRVSKYKVMQRLRCKDCGTSCSVASEGKEPKSY